MTAWDAADLREQQARLSMDRKLMEMDTALMKATGMDVISARFVVIALIDGAIPHVEVTL